MRIPAAELPSLDDAVGPVLVDLGGPVTPEVVDAARRSHAVLVGLGGDPGDPLREHLALTLVGAGAPDDPRAVPVADPEAAAAQVVDAVGRAPGAAAVLVQLLRLSAGLDVADALRAESLAYSALQGGPEHRAWLASRTPRPPLPHDEPVRLSRDGDVLHVRLSRPARRNAVDRHLRDALVDALELVRLDASLAVELTGEGPCFSSGGDLDEFGTATDPVAAHLVRTRRSAGLALHRVADRATARVHGPCAGAGVEVPLFAGHVVAAEGATLRLPELAMGVVPGAGGTVSLPRRAGRWRTAWMVLTGEPVGTTTARAWGLVDAVE